jgi:hypothetical protein
MCHQVISDVYVKYMCGSDQSGVRVYHTCDDLLQILYSAIGLHVNVRGCVGKSPAI